MSHRILRSDDAPPQAWRNGGGVTRELLSWPPGADWRARVSVADIERDGPFSAYPGVQRWFAVLKGPGVELVVDGHTHRLTRNDAPFRFDGAASVESYLIDGPTRDLNLMLRSARGVMQLVDDGVGWSPLAAACGLFTAVAGRCHADGRDVELPAYALLWFETAPASLVFFAGARPAGATGWWLGATSEGASP